MYFSENTSCLFPYVHSVGYVAMDVVERIFKWRWIIIVFAVVSCMSTCIRLVGWVGHSPSCTKTKSSELLWVNPHKFDYGFLRCCGKIVS